MKPELLTTNRKALTINLDNEIYGTFAEIGAGQEVARQFFKAGGAAGTIAKSMSAYDMKFSDEIYGKCKRYVSKDRLIQMLDKEFGLLTERLNESRGSQTCFFAFANTVAAASFKGGNECHGWMGLRFQLKPDTPPNDVLLHVRMLDKTNQAQQDALGIFGVNLIYGSYILHRDMNALIKSLLDNLDTDRIEVDMLEFHGPDFADVENRIVSLHLVEAGLTNAVMFGPDKSVLQPSEALHKKAVLVERGSFRPVTHVNLDMLRCAGAQFMQEEKTRGESILILMEITMNNLLAGGDIDKDDFLSRVDIISALGHPVLISNYFEYYRLSAYFRRYTDKMIGLVLGINNMLEIFNEHYYEHLDGGILEACGRLFKEDVRLYAYPMKAQGYNKYITDSQNTMPVVPSGNSDFLITSQNLQVKYHLRNLYQYLLENHYIEPVMGFDPACLDIFSRDVLAKIQSGDAAWEAMVPPVVAEIIKKRRLWHGVAANA